MGLIYQITIFQTLFTLHLDETYFICVPKQDYNHLFVVSSFVLFVIPMSIITILYVLIGLQLRKSKIVQRGAVNGSSVRLKVINTGFTMKFDNRRRVNLNNKWKRTTSKIYQGVDFFVSVLKM